MKNKLYATRGKGINISVIGRDCKKWPIVIIVDAGKSSIMMNLTKKQAQKMSCEIWNWCFTQGMK